MAEKVLEVRFGQGGGLDLVQFEDVILPKVLLEELIGRSIQEKLKQLKTVRYHDGDVLICTYPKTGTHWINNLVWMLLNTDKDNIDTTRSMAPTFLCSYGEEALTSVPSPRVLSIHLKPDRIPPELKQKAKLVYVVRNPKDTCVSLFHFYRWPRLGCEPVWDTVIRHFLHGPIAFGTYEDYLMRLQHELSVNPEFQPCILFYEDLKTDGLGQLRKLQEYLGLHHPDSHLQAVLDRCDVSKLKRDVNDGKVDSPLVDNDKKSILYRKGKIGDWKNHFTVAQNEMFDKLWAEKMADSVFKFKYE